VSSGIVPDSVSYNTIISGCCEADSLDKAIEIPAELPLRVLKQDYCSYNPLVNRRTTPWCQKEAISSSEWCVTEVPLGMTGFWERCCPSIKSEELGRICALPPCLWLYALCIHQTCYSWLSTFSIKHSPTEAEGWIGLKVVVCIANDHTRESSKGSHRMHFRFIWTTLLDQNNKRG